MRELQTLLTRTRDNEDRAFIEKKTAVSALFFETCAQHHETVITQGPSLLKRVSGGDDEDVWDRQNCAEALARSYQAVGRYEDANRLRDLRRGI
jgi:hypothetical protein